jgi:hypothetical protein
MTKPLSPAAQAIWEAFNEDEAGVFVDYGDKLAAALRAVVEQLGYSNVPEEFAHLRPLVIDSDDLLAIAAELEGTNPTNQKD